MSKSEWRKSSSCVATGRLSPTAARHFASSWPMANGNHSFLGALKEEPCGVSARMRCDRMLHKTPGEYSGKGRPRVHGGRFAFVVKKTNKKAKKKR